jgi:hypothetical protein
MFCEFLGFSSDKLKLSVILGYDTASQDNRCQNFEDCVVVLRPSNFCSLDVSTLETETVRQSRNVDYSQPMTCHVQSQKSECDLEAT